MSSPSFKCPFCKQLGADEVKWQTQHMPKCRARWVKRRQMERKAAGRPAMSDAERQALKNQDVFRGFEEED